MAFRPCLTALSLYYQVSPLLWTELQRTAHTPRGDMVNAAIDGEQKSREGCPGEQVPRAL